MPEPVVTVDFVDYATSVPAALDTCGAAAVLATQERVLVKPNLVEAIPHPVTTPPACVAAVVRYVRAHSGAAVVVAEGCGAAADDTAACFARLGYDAMAAEIDVPLVDLNLEPTVRLIRDGCTVFPEFHLPRIALEHFVLSVPVLKAHSLAAVTGTRKNMMGFAPPAHYQQGGHWKKSAFHRRMHESIVELNRYRAPDLTVMDASVGLAEYHLGGPPCDPPLGKLLAGFDPLAVDRLGAELLGLDWRDVPHLADDA
jgi:uncharacterized protein (DUF362 family)